MGRQVQHVRRPETAPERRFGGRVFRIGDKVSQIRNNYDKGANGVFNGTLGIITALDPVEQTLTVRTDEGETVSYDFAELDKDRWKINCPTCTSGVGGGVPVVDGDIQVQSVTARLNYRFGG